MQWFAQIDGQVYGPYSDTQMQSYVSEGRIVNQSLISNNPPEGFFQASSFDIYSFWSGTGQLSVQNGFAAPTAPSTTAPYTAPTPQNPVHNAIESVTQSFNPTSAISQSQPHDEHVDAVNICMVMAEIRSDSVMDFLTQLQDFGTAERVGDSVWLLKTHASVEALRNSLSQSLSRQDRMFIVDCVNNKTAWFNIGADLDSRIRKIWEG